MSPRAFVAAAGGALVVVGLLLLAVFGVSATAEVENPYSGVERAQTWECGTVLAPDRPADPMKWSPEQETACVDAFSTRQAWGWLLGGMGLLALVGSVAIRTQSRRVGKPAVGGGELG
ncbi:hypothetical protein [Kibdelosporangium phytohabitans]|uniref:Uncharacterized protein n=1 Tax=Kibdelosporangium phytohabitans TaxID=860235 RepID=A0A0N9HW06_9PSEU|nr:hypothetical protein [Kibdelosporangium phytohabitans]ALG07653.1 hypothetical protein AOZ06_12710 [Kibdelosporangium phytohabitans]ALG07709.1 hypothetical protein AOZ06_13030 [Kibdelosporangium phytohabitans]MBE1471390.1 hypothetical protein [Kibdelosporangium phytohabitans]